MSSAAFFNDVALALADGGSSVHAAEAHGCLCGALCARRNFQFADWLDEVLPEPPQDAAALEQFAPLDAAYLRTAAVLAAADMEFEPLLPDDGETLATRVEALGAWCHGFLYGFGAPGAGSKLAMTDDVEEVLGDLAQISRAGAVGAEAEPIEEEAYAELVEFLRVGAQLIYDELEPQRRTQPESTSRH